MTLSLLTAMAIAASMFLLAIAARTLPIGTAYAVWVGSVQPEQLSLESCT
jgi:multidrug transporter EmrE-like cation transporter